MMSSVTADQIRSSLTDKFALEAFDKINALGVEWKTETEGVAGIAVRPTIDTQDGRFLAAVGSNAVTLDEAVSEIFRELQERDQTVVVNAFTDRRAHFIPTGTDFVSVPLPPRLNA